MFDSGLGGLTVFRATAMLRPDADFTYLADDAGFPYGPLPPQALVSRVMDVVGDAIRHVMPDLVVIACNTASTLVLPPLRAAFPNVHFVGTVPAIKPAATLSKSGLISVLATPGTVTRDYTRDLIANHAAHCKVTLVGAPNLASLAEDFLRGRSVAEPEIAAAIAPCFVVDGEKRTDTIVLACTHYPLLSALLENAAPWPVSWIDPAPAIARRVASLLDAATAPGRGDWQARFISGAYPEPALRKALMTFGLTCDEQPTALCA